MSLFRNECDPYRAPAGYVVTYFRETLPVMDTILSDKQHFPDELARRYGLTTDETKKPFCLYQPVAQTPRRAHQTFPGLQRIVVRSCGPARATEQKNPDLLAKIVRANPSHDFHVSGTQERKSRLPRLRNLFVHGAFSNSTTSRIRSSTPSCTRAYGTGFPISCWRSGNAGCRSSRRQSAA